ncbi:HNH endonuclease signature motif containing protein [Pseudonocardia sp. WMMC193]|uniref:HNH endonuclease signature motif containing protein n=1 Tax=Pseudonocardia sp. WMMC193 TaxID=2911965 RepID=UPI001F19E761|nr:HNH endonuclease signature motif containing protein [Pseudonocardia sp. WMMC193]MCF7552193.1 HNH endonuclease [Pseudonocardia sp. WMMC193]
MTDTTFTEPAAASTGRAESLRRRWKQTAWGRLYRARMRAGLEPCRWCGARDHPSNPLTLDHIIPISADGDSSLDNLTILCEGCNTFKGGRTWALESLAQEEESAPPQRRWAERVSREVYQRRYPCPSCTRPVRADQSSRLVPHPTPDDTNRCPGTRRRVTDDSVTALLLEALETERIPGATTSAGLRAIT